MNKKQLFNDIKFIYNKFRKKEISIKIFIISESALLNQLKPFKLSKNEIKNFKFYLKFLKKVKK